MLALEMPVQGPVSNTYGFSNGADSKVLKTPGYNDPLGCIDNVLLPVRGR
jgi:hypothetical protein